MRTSHLQKRRFAADSFDDFQDDAKVSLLRKEDRLEAGECVNVPSWAGRVEGLNYQISRLESRVSELNSLHVKLLTRPGFEDTDGEEERIASVTAEMTKQLGECNKQLAALQRMVTSLRGHQRTVLTNIVTNLVTRLHGVTGEMRTSQGKYLRSVEEREQRSSQYFTSLSLDNDVMEEEDGLVMAGGMQDMIQLQENSKFLRKRDKDIRSIVESLQDVNTLFQDLAGMVKEQGEVVDRIDYNIEMASVQVDAGLQQLQKAAKYQKSNAKMKCILLLSASLIFLIFLLIITKT